MVAEKEDSNNNDDLATWGGFASNNQDATKDVFDDSVFGTNFFTGLNSSRSQEEGDEKAELFDKDKTNGEANASLLEQIESLERNISQITTDKETEISLLQKEKEEMSQRITNLSSQIKTFSADLVDVKKAAEDECGRLNAKITELEQALLESRQCSACKATEIASLNDELKGTQTSLSDITLMRDELSAEYEALKKELSILVAAKEAETWHLQNDLSSVREQIVVVEAQKVDLLKVTKEKDAAIDSMENEKLQLVERVQILEQNEQELLAKEKERCEQIKGLIEQLDTTEEELERCKAEVKSLSSKLIEVENECDVYRKQTENAAREVATLERSLEERSNKISELEAANDVQCNRTVQLSADLKSTASTLSDVQLLINSDNKQAQEMRDKIQSLEADNKVLQESMMSLKNERDDIESRLKFSVQEVDDLVYKLESSELLAEFVTNQCEKITVDRENAESELNICRQEANNIQNELNTSQHLAKSMASKCDQLAKERDSIQAKLDASESLARTLATKCDELKSCTVKMNTKHDAAEALMEDIITSLKKEYEAFKVESRIIEKDRSNLLERMKTAETDLKAAVEERNCLENVVVSLKNEYDTFKVASAEELEAAQDENIILGEQVHILSSEVSRYKLQNKGMLQALDEITNINHNGRSDVPMDELAVNREVEKRLASFRHQVELQSNASSLGIHEISLS